MRYKRERWTDPFTTLMMGLFVVSSHSMVLWGPSYVWSIHSFKKKKASFFTRCLSLLPPSSQPMWVTQRRGAAQGPQTETRSPFITWETYFFTSFCTFYPWLSPLMPPSSSHFALLESAGSTGKCWGLTGLSNLPCPLNTHNSCTP